MDNKALLSGFLDFQKSKYDLVQFYGEDLLNAVGATIQVSTGDIINAIDKYTHGHVTLSQLLDWVNILWFTDLFEYNEDEAESIASVMTVLESLDEDGVSLSEDDYLKMKECLFQNQEYQ